MPQKTNKNFWIGFLASLIFIGGVFFLVKNYRDRKSQELSRDYAYEALVQMTDQKSDDPVVDRRLNLKKGDVLVVFPKGHEWTETEKQNYLILKLKISEEEAAKLVEADIGEMPTDGASVPPTTGLVRLRAYRIRTESLKFDPNTPAQYQPFQDKVYDWGIVEKKQ